MSGNNSDTCHHVRALPNEPSRPTKERKQNARERNKNRNKKKVKRKQKEERKEDEKRQRIARKFSFARFWTFQEGEFLDFINTL